MMAGYRISMGGWVYKPTDEIIHSSDSIDRQVHGAKLEMSVGGMSKLTFTMPPTHPLASSIEILRYGNTTKSISLYFDNDQLFHGVVVSKSEDMDGEITVTCYDDLVMLQEANVVIFSGDLDRWRLPRMAAGAILDEYNELVPDDMHVVLGDVPTDIGVNRGGSSTYIEMPASGKAMTALDALNVAFVKPYGCHLRMIPTGSPTSYKAMLRIYSGSEGDSRQVVRFGENLTDYTSEVYSDGIYTAVMPIGRNYDSHPLATRYTGTITRNAPIGSERVYFRAGSNYTYGDWFSIGEEYTEYEVTLTYNEGGGELSFMIKPALEVALSIGDTITIYRGGIHRSRPRMLDSQPDGTYGPSNKYRKVDKTLYNIDAVERYGLRSFVLDMPDEGHSDVLMSAAINALGQHPAASLVIEIQAVDMVLYSDDPTYHHLTAGQTLRVVSEPHGVDVTMMVSAVRIDLDDPSRTSYTLGVQPSTVSGKLEENRVNMSILDDNIMYRIGNL